MGFECRKVGTMTKGTWSSHRALVAAAFGQTVICFVNTWGKERR